MKSNLKTTRLSDQSNDLHESNILYHLAIFSTFRYCTMYILYTLYDQFKTNLNQRHAIIIILFLSISNTRLTNDPRKEGINIKDQEISILSLCGDD